jgi:hypothetical protein
MPSLDRPDQKVYYLLPLKWSLHYVMTKKEWESFRSRIKQLRSDWEKCPTCPNQCRANSLDEDWDYDGERHLKRFLKATFICPGCHWLKTPPWRTETWLEMERGEMPPATKPPHILSCLGWTQDRVDELRRKDLARHRQEVQAELLIEKEVQAGLAQIRYWTAELSALDQYGYSAQEITEFECRMNNRV